jgi:hypothetical protein
MPLEAYSPGTVTVELGSDPVTTLVVELGTPGPQGIQGEPGQNGTNGTNGVGVPVGGSAGQVLAKIDGTNYNTEWVDVVNPEDGFTLNTGAIIDANSGTVNLGAVNIGGPFAMEASGYLYLQDGSKSVTILPDNGITLAGGANLKFSDNSTQTTAFIDAPSDGNKYARKNGTWEQFNGGVWGQITGTLSNQTDLQNALNAKFNNPTGTTAQYIRGDGSLATYNTGDRYLTTSTTTLTINNSQKTLTVGTGLSYSTQQDVTIAHDAANHMHATVVSYDTNTGVMVADVLHKSGSGTYSSWTVNVGGMIGGSYLQVQNNLSDLSSVSVARSNLGLGSMALATATDYLDKAGNLSGLASASTARTNLGLAYATDAEVLAGTSTTTVVSPSSLYSIEPKWFSPAQSGYATRVSGGTVLQTPYGGWCNLTPTASGQYATRYIQQNQISIASSGTSYSNINFSKRNKIYGRMYLNGTISSALNCYFGVGRPYNPAPG